MPWSSGSTEPTGCTTGSATPAPAPAGSRSGSRRSATTGSDPVVARIVRPMPRSREALFRAVSDAVLGMASERTVEGSLRALAAADGEGGFRRFITVGMSPSRMAAIGPLPRTHGMLGAMLESTAPYRSHDLTQEPRFEGYPGKHPVMHSFLGVPIVRGGTVLGAFYLTSKRGRRDFSERDQEAIELLAAHAAVALENADLLERSRELSVVEERNRLARELHDAVSQTLFSAAL